jgi:hypothetical protein
MVTDGYGILVDNIHGTVSNPFVISGNTITVAPGKSSRGLLLENTGGSIYNGEIFNNYVDIREKGNREYGVTGIVATAFRMRTYGDAAHHDIHLHDNTFIARTSASGETLGAIGGRITYYSNNQAINLNNLFENNIFKAIVETTDTNYYARAFSFDGVAANTAPLMRSNFIESNDISLALAGSDGNGYALDGDFISTTFRKSVDGAARSYKSIVAGYSGFQVSNVQIIDSRYENGATSTIVWTGSGVKDISIGKLLPVQTKTTNGIDMAGATVEVFDRSGASVFTGTTDAHGMLAVPIVTTIYRQEGTNPKTITTDLRGNFNLRFSKVIGGVPYTWSTSVVLNENVWNVVGFGDFNADGTDDVLVHDQTTGEIGVWTVRNGQYTGYKKISVADPASWIVAGVADFNCDGTDDILLRNTVPANGGIGVWIVQNSSFVRWSSIGVADPMLWDVDGVGDFNRDGTADILLHNRINGGVGVWLINNGSFSRWSSIGAADPAQWEVSGAGDFNRDGTADVLLHNKVNGGTGTWLIQNGCYKAWSNFGNAVPAATWTAGGALDGNADGTTDVFLKNISTGDTGVWKISNGQYAGWQSIGRADLSTCDIVGFGKLFGGATDGIVLRNRNTQEVIYWRLNNAAFSSLNTVSVITAFFGPAAAASASQAVLPAVQTAATENAAASVSASSAVSTTTANDAIIASMGTRHSIENNLNRLASDRVFSDLTKSTQLPRLDISTPDISQDTLLSKLGEVSANRSFTHALLAGNARSSAGDGFKMYKMLDGAKNGAIDESLDDDLLEAIGSATREISDVVDYVIRNEAASK